MPRSRSRVVAIIRGLSWPLATCDDQRAESKHNKGNRRADNVVRKSDRPASANHESRNPSEINAVEICNSKRDLFQDQCDDRCSPHGRSQITPDSVTTAPVHFSLSPCCTLSTSDGANARDTVIRIINAPAWSPFPESGNYSRTFSQGRWA